MGKMLRIKNSDDMPSWVTLLVQKRVRNATIVPKIYYGMHFAQGVAEYREKGVEPYRVFINEATAKKMDRTFEGRPLVVLHTEESLEEILPNIMEKADGFVIESFFNQADGKHWAKFLVITDEGHQAIAKGWALSNCYKIRKPGRSGQWQGMDFQNEVLEGEYEHLAIVPNPRYESVIMTPEDFKAYNDSKKSELALRLANSNDKGDKMKISFFKKQKVEKLDNAADLESLSVILPKSKAEVTVAEAIADADTLRNMQGYASDDHMVKVNDSEEMSVKDLKSKYNEMVDKSKKEEEEASEGEGDADADTEFNDDDGEEEAEEDASLDNDLGDEELEEEAEAETPAQKKTRLANAKKEQDRLAKARKAKNFNSITNAADRDALKKQMKNEADVYDSERAQLQRGQDRYGSAKK